MLAIRAADVLPTPRPTVRKRSSAPRHAPGKLGNGTDLVPGKTGSGLGAGHAGQRTRRPATDLAPGDGQG